MAHEPHDVETAVERAICDCSSASSPLHLVLRRLFLTISKKLRGLGDVVVILDGGVTALGSVASPHEILSCAGKDPKQYCVFRMNPCGGPPAPVAEGDRLQDGDRLVITLCTPPPDGLGRAASLEVDLRKLAAVAKSPRVVLLEDGKEAILAEFALPRGGHVTCGVVVNPSYPKVGPDWFLIDMAYELSSFTGQRRGPYRLAGLALMEFSIHPPKSQPIPSAAEHVIAVAARRLSMIQQKAA